MALSAERAREALHYDPETGVLTWRVKVGKRIRPGMTAGNIDVLGYVSVGLDGGRYRAHQLIWLIVTGEWPKMIDHRNCDRADNRWENLRHATMSENMANMRGRARSGFKGVSLTPKGRWSARITRKYKAIYLGLFDTPEEAHRAYVAAAEEHFGEFARP